MRKMTYLLIVLLAVALAACTAPAANTPAPTEAVSATEGTGTTEQATATTGSAAPADTPAASDTPAPADTPAQQAGGRIATIQERGTLICGYNGTLPGFGTIDSSGVVTGFDADFCRVLAAAILGDAEAVEWRPLNAQERFTAVQTGEVDVLIRNTTYTYSRDTDVGLDFGPITFYDGQGMMVRKDSGITTLEELDGANICVQSGTTTELNLADNFRQLGLSFTPVVFSENDQVVAAYDAGQCDGFTTDKSGLVSSQTLMTNPADHQILEATMSKEPLGPSILQGDVQFRDVLTWAVYATIQAEEFGIDSTNIDTFLETEDPNIARFLGVDDSNLGDMLGLSNDWVQAVIRGTGNYGEIYARNLGEETPFNLPRGLNDLHTNGGLLYAPPFR
jgi:general L-amino acid transport system substrate-binding protein